MQTSARLSSVMVSVSPGAVASLFRLALAIGLTAGCSSSGAPRSGNPDAQAPGGSGGPNSSGGSGIAGGAGVPGATGGHPGGAGGAPAGSSGGAGAEGGAGISGTGGAASGGFADGGGRAGGGGGAGAGGGVAGAAGGGPPVQLTDRWLYRTANGFDRLRGPAIVGGAAEGVVAYLTVPNPDNTGPSHVNLQRIDAQGVRAGAPVVLATSTPSSAPTVATDGQRVITCWSEADQARCASLAPGQTQLTPIYGSAGVLPTLVHGPQGWLLGWRSGTTDSAAIVLQKMHLTETTAASSFEPEGAPLRLSPTGTAGAPIIAATESGFVLASGPTATVQRLGPELQTQGPAIDLGVTIFYWEGAMVATDSWIAVALAQPYAALLSIVDAANQVTRSSLNGGVKLGMRMGLSSDPTGLAAFWAVWDADRQKSWVFQHPLSQSPAASPYGFGQPVLADEEGHMALARVGDTFFVALSDTSGEIEILSAGR